MGEIKRIKSVSESGELRLLTVVSARKDAGSSPTGIVGRSLARQLLAVGDRVRVIAESDRLAGWPDTIRRELVVREAFLNESHYPSVHEDDLAAVAVSALRDDEYVGGTLEAVGLPLSTLSRVRSIAKTIGRSLRAYDDRAIENADRFR